MKIATRILIAGLLAVVAGCTVHEVEPPPLTGPSEFGLRIALRAIPDSILQDGASQSVIEIDVSGPDGRPVRGQPLRIEIFLDGIPQDFGTLSAKTVVTGDDGRARVTYTAPPRPLEPVDEGIVITVHVTPIGSDFRGETPRTVDIRLVTPGVIRPPIPPNEIPVAMFTFAPTAPVVGQTVTFDASTSTDVINGAPVPCGSRCTYAWSFGDGDTATGIFATHVYRRADTYQVRLTVTDAQGATGQAAQTVPVTLVPAAPPTASFVFSPQNPAVSQPVTFNASASRATLGRSIVSYAWDFGDGGRGQGVIVTKTYTPCRY